MEVVGVLWRNVSDTGPPVVGRVADHWSLRTGAGRWTGEVSPYRWYAHKNWPTLHSKKKTHGIVCSRRGWSVLTRTLNRCCWRIKNHAIGLQVPGSEWTLSNSIVTGIVNVITTSNQRTLTLTAFVDSRIRDCIQKIWFGAVVNTRRSWNWQIVQFGEHWPLIALV